MSRMTFTALAVSMTIVWTNTVQAERWNTLRDQRVRLVTWADTQPGSDAPVDTGQPSYDELLEKVETLQRQLDAAYEMAERYGTDEELQEFREIETH